MEGRPDKLCYLDCLGRREKGRYLNGGGFPATAHRRTRAGPHSSAPAARYQGVDGLLFESLHTWYCGEVRARRRRVVDTPKLMAGAAKQMPMQGPDARANQLQDDDELEKPRGQQPGFFSRRRILGPVEKDYGDYGLLACSLVTGMVDGASFLNWGVFVGMQTGRFPDSARSTSIP